MKKRFLQKAALCVTVVLVVVSVLSQKSVNAGELIYSENLSIEGFQYSTVYNGYRVIGCVEPEIEGKAVVEYGFIYGATFAGIATKDMTYDSDSKLVFVHKSEAVDGKYGTSDTGTYFITTMVGNGTTSEQLNAKYSIRAYAVTEDGMVYYTLSRTYSVYSICDKLYKGGYMSTPEKHNYLYDNILKIANPDYIEIDYGWAGGFLPIS